jgi:S1-C subfamily serine protease
MKHLGLLIMIVGLTLAYVYHSRDQTLDDEMKDIQNASLRLVVSIDEGSRFGSAVIFDESDEYYFALTNEHVLRDANRIQAIDYHQNSYEALMVENSLHISYDLGIIKIDKLHDLSVLSFASSSSLASGVIAVGYPNSIFDITHGVITSIEGIEHTITFPVIHHNAYIEMGSSGGALLNLNHDIIGINFAVYHDESGFVESYAIPVEKVSEYLLTMDYMG